MFFRNFDVFLPACTMSTENTTIEFSSFFMVVHFGGRRTEGVIIIIISSSSSSSLFLSFTFVSFLTEFPYQVYTYGYINRILG